MFDIALYERNRTVLSKRCGWPEGTLDTCRAIESDYPHMNVTYSPGSNTPWCTYYVSTSWQYRGTVIYAATSEDLRAEIELLPVPESPY